MTASDFFRAWTVSATIGCLTCGSALGQIVINELVKEERTAGSGAVTPDVREFIELYNAGGSTVDLSNWSIVRWDFAADGPGAPNITLPAGSMIAPGGYFVIGGSGLPPAQRDYMPGAGTDLFPDLLAYALELRDASNTLVDAVGYDVHRPGIFPPTAEQAAQIGQGFHAQLISMNAIAPNVPESWGRWVDGRDSNNNGRDFGILPITPRASNNLPQVASHTVPNVDGLTTGSVLSQYHASFVLPRVIDPAVVDVANPRVIPASPQGGKAIAAWDNTGGGNTVYSKELVNKFDIYAYFDTTPLGIAATTNDEEWETTSYGIGTSDAFYGTPDPTGIIFVPGTVTGNGSSGIGWVYQQYENPIVPELNLNHLMLVDFGDGGNSTPDAAEWNVIQTIDMSTVAAGWYRLGIDYNPTTGAVTATFNDQTFNFNTATNLLGSFFVGYREGVTAEQTRLNLLNPPIYDVFSAAPPVLAGDYNDDGTVNAADYVVWRDRVGTTNPMPNDPIGGQIGTAHYDQWKANFGKTLGSGSGLVAVPEPAAAVLIALAVLAAAGIRRP